MSFVSKLHKSQVLLLLLSAFLIGTFFGQFTNPPQARILFLSATIAAIALSTAFWGSRKVWVFCAAVAALFFGIWHFNGSVPVIDSSQIASFNGSGKISWQGVVTEEPDVREGKIMLTVTAEQANQPPRSISGKVLVTVGRYPEYQYGDRLQLSGKLEEPFESADFSYKNYLAKSGIYAVSSYPQVKLQAQNMGNPVKAALLRFKAFFIERLSRVLPEPQNALLGGLLVGARRSIPADLLNMFKITGVTHIIAISGFNISIITRLLGRFIQERLGRRLALGLTVLVVLAFVIITGAAASVVRAAIMGVVVVLAVNLGRMSRAANILVLTAAIMVFLNPKILLFDIGFQLSFLATAGLIFFSDYLEQAFAHVPNIFELRSTLAATLSAQVFVWPLLIYNFDQLSLVAPITNILILPIIPWAMLFGFISGSLAMIWIPISYITTWITWAFLTYQIAVVRFFSALPYASVNIQNLPESFLISYYLLLASAIFALQVRLRNRRIEEFSKAGT